MIYIKVVIVSMLGWGETFVHLTLTKELLTTWEQKDDGIIPWCGDSWIPLTTVAVVNVCLSDIEFSRNEPVNWLCKRSMNSSNLNLLGDSCSPASCLDPLVFIFFFSAIHCFFNSSTLFEAEIKLAPKKEILFPHWIWDSGLPPLLHYSPFLPDFLGIVRYFHFRMIPKFLNDIKEFRCLG